jgi:PEP-CTERM motif
MNMKKFIATCVTAIASSGQLFAAPLDITNIIGSWANPVLNTATFVINNVAGQGTDTLRYGEPATTSGQSGYDFTPTADIINVALGTAFLLGTFTHLNQPVVGGLLSIDYMFGFSTNGAPATLSNTFHFLQTDTANVEGQCPAGPQGPSLSICDDFVNISSASLNQPIIVGGDTYHFNLLGFSSDGGVTINSDYQSPEGTNNSVGLYAIVIPEPGSLALLTLGLLGFAGLRSKKKQA